MKLKNNHQKGSKLRILLLGMIFIFASCDLFLDVHPPKTELATASVFTSNSTANAAMTSIYARMATNNGTPFSRMTWLSGLSSDEFINYGTSENIILFYNNSLTAINPNVINYFWTPYYNIIFQANAVLEGLETSTGVSENVKNQLIGEAKFMRAFYHFYLTCFFGEIPVITTTDYRVNATLPRASQSVVYDQIVADLNDAKSVLAPHYVGADGVSNSTERVRPNRPVAEALLARVYLYMGEYEMAEQEASQPINNPLFGLLDDLKTVFLKNSTEAIWQVQPIANTSTTYADQYILTGMPNTESSRSTSLSEYLISKYEADDRRLSDWIGSVIVDDQTFFFPNKHRETLNNSKEYNMVMRLAEQYLIRAEARIRLGKIQNGLHDLNTIRLRAGVQGYDIETIDADPLLLVEQERQRELFAEGHRWFDLRRTGRIDDVMAVVTPAKGGQWSTDAKLYPIPQNERNNNTSLTQNSGY